MLMQHYYPFSRLNWGNFYWIMECLPFNELVSSRDSVTQDLDGRFPDLDVLDGYNLLLVLENSPGAAVLPHIFPLRKLICHRSP